MICGLSESSPSVLWKKYSSLLTHVVACVCGESALKWREIWLGFFLRHVGKWGQGRYCLERHWWRLLVGRKRLVVLSLVAGYWGGDVTCDNSSMERNVW